MKKTALAIISIGCMLIILSAGLDGNLQNIDLFLFSIIIIIFGIYLLYKNKKETKR
ncbi:MAG: hypothetical protein FWF57_10325 [Defluviitaleaceae bacterium]|nr:hypothetical protein [Defluviitaleaceae bacterium]